MIIDLSKLMYNQVDSVEIDDYTNIPKEYYENNGDIKDISKVHVSGEIVSNNSSFTLYLNIKCDLTLVCSVSLKDVPYKIDINIEENLSDIDENIEDFDKIINNSIDLVPIIWQNILLEVPIRIVSPDIKEENIYKDGWKFITNMEEDKSVDPRLEKLKDFLSE